MRTKTMISLLLLSALAATPAAANWFSRPDLGINLNIGSAPNPTPNDLRLAERYVGAPLVARQVTSVDVLRDMDGKNVYGENGELLGNVLAVDEAAGMLDVQLDTGVAVAVNANMLINEPERIVAPTLSRADILEMARMQTGTTVALNVTHF